MTNRHNRSIVAQLTTVLVLTLILLLSGCLSTRESDFTPIPISSTDSPRAQDLKTFYNTLPVVHTDFFANTSPETFNAAFHSALGRIDSLSDIDFYYTLGTLAALAGDSHTAVGLTQEIVSQVYAIPVQIARVAGNWCLSVTEASQANLLGAKILAINGISMDVVVDKASCLFGHDNNTWLYNQIAQQLNLTSLYTYLGIAENPSADVQFTIEPYGSTEAQSITFKAVTVTQFYQLQLVSIQTNPPETASAKVPYRTLLLEQGKTLFIQYNACISWDQLPIGDFIDETLGMVNNLSPEHIIIDLRYNGGGNSQLFEPMINALAGLQKEKGFAIDVLIGQGTFSSALMNAVQLNQRTDCRLVGTPTGGSVNHFGEIKNFTLPNSGISVQYSTQRFIMDASYPAGSLQPELYVEKTITDIMHGVDTEVQAIL